MLNQIAKEIGRALIAGTPQARALAIARATCNAVAVSQMFCERCGAVHDQEKVVVIEQGEDPEHLTALGACCPKCWQESYAVRMKADVAKGDAKLWKTTWKGTEPITTAEDEERIYKIVRYRENGTRRTIRDRVTLTEAKEHCSDPKTSGIRNGIRWFDGYTTR